MATAFEESLTTAIADTMTRMPFYLGSYLENGTIVLQQPCELIKSAGLDIKPILGK